MITNGIKLDETGQHFSGVLYDKKGVAHYCEHRHASDKDAMACGNEMLKAYLAKHKPKRP